MPRKAGDHPSLIERAKAAESTIAKFAGQGFIWGKSDCLRLVAHTLRQLGHAPPLRDAGVYSSHLGARRALKRTGFATLPEWVDSWGLLRIPPAMVLTGDVVALPSGDAAMPALALALPNGRVLGFVPELGVAASVMLAEGVSPLAAWRV